MAEKKPRVAGALVGNIHTDPGARIKYGYFFEAVEEQFTLIDVFDAALHGRYRYFNALRNFRPNWREWRERFYKNVPAFRLRSRLASDYFREMATEIDLVLQVGVLFDARWHPRTPPSVIYTDYTAHLAAQRPASGRSPFSSAERARWLALERAAFERARHICTRSDLVRRSIIEDYGINPGSVSVIGGGINFSRLPPPVSVRSTDEPVILFIGKEFYRKGGDILLEAFARVREEIPDACLKMITSGPLPAAVSLKGVKQIKPTWEREVIVHHYRSADVFVLPSRLETWGDVLLEAMSFALPCIGVTGQAMEEIIEHDVSGLIVPEEDAGALAGSLLRLLTDPGLRRRLGRQARIDAKNHFQWRTVVQRLSGTLREVAAHD